MFFRVLELISNYPYLDTSWICHWQLMAMEFRQLAPAVRVVQLQNRKPSLSFYAHIVLIAPLVQPIFLDRLSPKK